jgi:hypothetical protein
MSSIVVIDPRHMEFAPWAQQNVGLLGRFGPIPDPVRLHGGWCAWALAVVQLPQIAARRPPDPTEFTDWRQWAARFNGVMS